MSRNQRRNRRNKQGGGQNANRNQNRDNTQGRTLEAVRHRSSTETKSSLKTTELIAYAGAVLAVIMTALAVDGDGQGRNDPFGAESAMRYITYLTIGYLVARGLAKAGSHENRIERAVDTGTDDDDDDDGDDSPGAVVADDRDAHDDSSYERDSDPEYVDAAVPSDRVVRTATTDDVDTRP
jgi:hypothetical protein